MAQDSKLDLFPEPLLWLLVLLVSYIKKNHCLIQGHEALQLCFIVLALSFRSLIPFELILYVVYTRDSTSFFDCGWPVVLSHLLKILFLPLLNCHVSLVKNQLTKKKKINWPKMYGFLGVFDSQFYSIDLHVSIFGF